MNRLTKNVNQTETYGPNLVSRQYQQPKNVTNQMPPYLRYHQITNRKVATKEHFPISNQTKLNLIS